MLPRPMHVSWIAVSILLVMTPSVFSAEQNDGDFVWFGTSARSGTDSDGIYVSGFDPATGRLEPAVLATQATNASFLAAHPSRGVIYATGDIDGPSGKRIGGVSAFTINEDTGLLSAINATTSGGNGPCHISVDPKGKSVLVANYGGGSVACLGLSDDGTLKPFVNGRPGGFVQHDYDRHGTPGIDANRQEKPHAHSIDVSPDERFAFVCDLGLDQIVVYRLDTERATLAPHDHATVSAGSGPRHFAMHPSGRLAWCVNELALTVTGFAYHAESGTLTELETLSTLPQDTLDRHGFTCAEIAVHPSGKFLYASTRGHDSIASYRIDEATGQLTFLGVEPTRAATPRHFAIAPGGEFLLAAGQTSHNVTVFAIDEGTGKLTFTGQSIEVPSPACVLFRP